MVVHSGKNGWDKAGGSKKRGGMDEDWTRGGSAPVYRPSWKTKHNWGQEYLSGLVDCGGKSTEGRTKTAFSK